MGFVFLWAFLDKTFGLRHSTGAPREDGSVASSWIDGGAPSRDTSRTARSSPAKDLFASMASPLTDWLFMLGMLGVGLAVVLGIGLRVSAVAGSLLMMSLWLTQWPPRDGSMNPVVDQHLAYTLVLIVCALFLAGGTRGGWGAGGPACRSCAGRRCCGESPPRRTATPTRQRPRPPELSRMLVPRRTGWSAACGAAPPSTAVTGASPATGPRASAVCHPARMSGRGAERDVAVPVNAQRWTDLAFARWRYDQRTLQRLVPPGSRCSCWTDRPGSGSSRSGWARCGRPPLPPVPGWSDFPELNLRTYVRGPDGREGVWFFSLACPRRAFVAAMRGVGLPYQFARAEVTSMRPGPGSVRGTRYRFARAGLPSRPSWRLDAQVVVGEPLSEAARTALVDALTARWAAYSHVAGALWRIPISHEPWPLHAAAITGDLAGPITAAGLPAPDEGPLAHYSPGVASRIGLPSSAG